MRAPVDLHTHSTASDGSLPPRDLVRLAHERGLSAIALTDHDTLAGLQEAREEAERLGIELVPGVELAASHGKEEIHLLGYFVDPASPLLSDALARAREWRARRNPLILERLRALGCDVTMEEVAAEAGPGTPVGRPHIATILVRKGYVATLQEAFDRYLADGGPAHVPKEKLSAAEAVRLVHAAGGLAVLAHPVTVPERERMPLLDLLAREGLDGVEVLYPKQDAALQEALTFKAASLGLVVTGGSDFHGSRKPDTALGTGIGGNLRVPYDVLEAMKARLARRARA